MFVIKITDKGKVWFVVDKERQKIATWGNPQPAQAFAFLLSLRYQMVEVLELPVDN